MMKKWEICEDEICRAVVDKLYSKATDIMHRCRDAGKCVFFLDIGYILTDWKYPGVDRSKVG